MQKMFLLRTLLFTVATSFSLVGCSDKTTTPAAPPQSPQAVPLAHTPENGYMGSLPLNTAELEPDKPIPPIKYGKAMRRQIFNEDCKVSFQADSQAEKLYPEGDDDPVLTPEQSNRKAQLRDDLNDKYEAGIEKKYKLTSGQITKITVEALDKHWPDLYNTK